MSAYPSTDDRRAPENNILRHEYRTLSDEEKARIQAVKDAGAHFLGLCQAAGASREISLARTKIEEAVFWAVKHLTA
jgi:hypothetical protein